MKIEDGKIVLEKQDCWACKNQTPKGKQPGRKVCPACNGTMRGPRGGKNGCRFRDDRGGQCYQGSLIDFDNMVTCDACGGDWEMSENESWTDYFPGAELLKHVELRLIPTDIDLDWRAQHMGAGFWTMVDYGAHRTLTGAELIEMVREHLTSEGIQVCKFVKSKDDLSLPDYIGVFSTNQGYFPAAIHGDTVKLHA